MLVGSSVVVVGEAVEVDEVDEKKKITYRTLNDGLEIDQVQKKKQ